LLNPLNYGAKLISLAFIVESARSQGDVIGEISCAQNAAILQKALQFSKSTSRRGSLYLSPAD
jgi:hypothetical protein